MTRAEETSQTSHDGAAFATTMWSVVLAAGDREKPGAQQALERLCRTYWRPIYAYLRRAGEMPADAEDLTQGFLASLLARDSFAAVGPERGRFRSFLLASLRHFISDQRDRANALKRGGGQRLISLEAQTAEAFYARQATTGETPERSFERDWAQSVLARAQVQLQSECKTAGKGALYDELGPDGERGRSQAEIAAAHGMSENAVRLAAFRLRQRYQELVRAEIRDTVSSEAELEEEIRHLLRVFSR
jgi:RNA polymerase sigma-70 factor (ECF subfamily)